MTTRRWTIITVTLPNGRTAYVGRWSRITAGDCRRAREAGR